MSDATQNAQTEFFVSKGDEQLGPWTIDEIADRLARTGEPDARVDIHGRWGHVLLSLRHCSRDVGSMSLSRP